MNVPESWDEITVRQLVEMEQLGTDGPNDIDRSTKLLSIVTETPEEVIKRFDIGDYIDLVADLSSVMAAANVSKYQERITIGDETFTATDVRSWATREFVDFDTLARDKGNIPILLALIYRKDGEILDGEHYATTIRQRSQMFENLPASVAIGAIRFFTKNLLDYISNTLLSSGTAREVMKRHPKLREMLMKASELTDGVGL